MNPSLRLDQLIDPTGENINIEKFESNRDRGERHLEKNILDFMRGTVSYNSCVLKTSYCNVTAEYSIGSGFTSEKRFEEKIKIEYDYDPNGMPGSIGYDITYTATLQLHTEEVRHDFLGKDHSFRSIQGVNLTGDGGLIELMEGGIIDLMLALSKYTSSHNLKLRDTISDNKLLVEIRFPQYKELSDHPGLSIDIKTIHQLFHLYHDHNRRNGEDIDGCVPHRFDAVTAYAKTQISTI